mgnify:CR=1 FL=1
MCVQPNPAEGKEETAQDKLIKATIASIWDQYDTNGNGFLERDEAFKFIKQTMADIASEIQYSLSDEECEAAFNTYDSDGSGQISKTEMHHFIKKLLA